MDIPLIKKAGLKVTLPRVKILRVLEGSDKRHVTAEEVHKTLLEQGEEIGLATVYRVLGQFEAAGLICRHRFEGGQAVYELDRDGHHDHFVCLCCGRVQEFVDPVIEERQRVIAAAQGFTIEDHALVIYGLCSEPGCRAAFGQAEPPPSPGGG